MALIPFYKTETLWVIGENEGVPAGEFIRQIKNGIITIRTVESLSFAYTSGSQNGIIAQGLYSDFCNSLGVAYVSLDAFKTATNDFFVEAPLSGANVTLTGTTTAEKIVLSKAVYDDVNFAVASAKVPAANTPSWIPFTANTNAYTFAVNDYADLGTIEIPHNYKEGSDIEVHLHLASNGVDTTDRGVKYQLFFTYGIPDSGSHQFAAEQSISAEITIGANTPDKSALYLSLGTIDGSAFKIGTHLKTRIKRITATGTAPTNAPFVGQLGVHYQIDSMGSTTISSK